MHPRTVAIVQARCGSGRLPRKILAPVEGRPMLARVMTRLSGARLVDQVVLATTDGPADDEVASLARAEGWALFRGSETDVLDRFYQAAVRHGAEVVVRITGDCPLIDPAVTDLVVATFLAHAPAVDYASNCLRRSYPRGLDTEVFLMTALRRAWSEGRDPASREHVTPFIYTHAGFRLADVVNAEDFSDHRWTVDTTEDLDLVREIYRHFGDGHFGWRAVLEAGRLHPAWKARNEHVRQKGLSEP